MPEFGLITPTTTCEFNLRGVDQAGVPPDASTCSAPLLEVARQRTSAADLRTGEIEALPQDDGSFDVVTAFNSIQYAVDPAQAVVELARVTRPGGKVVIGVWAEPARCETEALFAQLRSLAPPPPGASAPLAASKPGVVEGLLEKAGLEVTGGGEADCPFTFADHDAAFKAHISAGPLQKVVDIVGEEAVRTTIRDVLEADRKPDGQLRQDNVFRYVVATKSTG